jgi:hypothetical protein
MTGYSLLRAKGVNLRLLIVTFSGIILHYPLALSSKATDFETVGSFPERISSLISYLLLTMEHLSLVVALESRQSWQLVEVTNTIRK